MKKKFALPVVAVVLVMSSFFLTGFSVLWFGAGAATGVAVAEDAEDAETID